MSIRPSDGFGTRLAKYRKMAGLSARELSDKLHGEVSRGVIANIESGRKTDVTIDQLFAFAWALDIPPVALALPLEEPERFVALTKSETGFEAERSRYLVRWFLGQPDSSPHGAPIGPGRGYANALIRTLETYGWMQALVARREDQFEDGTGDQRAVEDARAELAKARRELIDLGAELRTFAIDE